MNKERTLSYPLEKRAEKKMNIILVCHG